MVYAEDLKSLTRNGLWVRVPLPAQKQLRRKHVFRDYCFLTRWDEKARTGAHQQKEMSERGQTEKFYDDKILSLTEPHAQHCKKLRI